MWPFKKTEIKVVEVDRVMNEIELASKLANLLGDVDSVEITKEGTKELFQAMSSVDGLADFFRDTMMNDIRRYFAAQTDHERDIIRGGFARTSYLRAQLLDVMRK